MSRSISEIYQTIVAERNKRLELKEFKSDSKMSILNGLSWVVAVVVHGSEVLMDVFTVDISDAMNSRINGTPTYYANMLLRYQKGDVLLVRSDGLAFGYSAIDESKQIITQVSYIESWDENNNDYKLILKTATGEKGSLTAISSDDLVAINGYIQKIAFAGTDISVISQQGDVFIPKITVYYNGSVSESEMYDEIEDALNNFITNIDFDSSIYVSKVIDAIQSVGNVVDVFIDESLGQGLFIARYNMDGVIDSTDKIERVAYTSSGFIRESSKNGLESGIPNFRESIKLSVGK